MKNKQNSKRPQNTKHWVKDPEAVQKNTLEAHRIKKNNLQNDHNQLIGI